MTPIAGATLLGMALATALALLGGALLVALRRGAAPALPAPLVDPPPTLALLPMRDEEANAVDCAAAVLKQTARPRVRVIDDGSRDRTVELLRALQVGQPRLELLAADPLSPGWRGKVNALATGTRGAAEPWLLLVDADARLEPELLARAHAALAAHRLDALSVAGEQAAGSFGEALLVPAVFGLLDGLLGDWRRAASGDGPPVASGTFVLVRRAALEASGGFAAIRTATIDDVALFRSLRAHGYRTAFWRAQELLRVRMYDGVGAAIAGWRRNFGAIFAGRPLAAAVGLLACFLPAATLVATLLAGAWLAAATLWLGGALASAVLRATGRSRLWPALLYPLGGLLLGATLALGLADRRRGALTRWKGREIRLEN
ncbi:MAG: glycosyltransferase [Acidobacteriota bacterium]